MKKIFLSAAILAALALSVSSCKKEEACCWKMAVTITQLGETEIETGYLWGTESEVEAYQKTMIDNAKLGDVTITFGDKSKATEYATREDCSIHNFPLDL